METETNTNLDKGIQKSALVKEVLIARNPVNTGHVIEKLAAQKGSSRIKEGVKEVIGEAAESESLKKVANAVEKIPEAVAKVVLVAVPGGQPFAVEAIAKEVASKVAKEAVKIVAKEGVGKTIDATESESLQHVKNPVVDYAARTVDTKVTSEGKGVETETGTKMQPHPKVELPPWACSEATQKPILEKNGCECVKLTENADHLNADSRSETKDKFPTNATVEVDGRKYETDDNGEIYAVDGKLMPNVEYSLNGFNYRTDEYGRIVHAEGEVKLTDKERDPMPEISSKDKRDTDDKGHVIGHQIGGLEKIGNLVPQDFNLNRGEYKKLENELARLAKDGHDIKVEVSLKYKEGSDRPDTFRVKYTVDGKTYVKVFKNESSKNGGNQ